jgi:hypothetical protein
VSASQQSTRISVKWFRKRFHRLEKNPAFQQEVDAIIAFRTGVWQKDSLRDQGWTKGEIEAEEVHWREGLTRLACLSVSPHQGRPAILERVGASKSGKTWKALLEFPDRLEKMADEVGRINAADPLFFARTPRWNVDRCDSAKLRHDCERLPNLMRSYANALRERNAAVATASPRDGRFAAVFNLSELVKTLTGAYHDSVVQRLLGVAAHELDEQIEFDAVSIAQLRYRRRKRPAQT